MTTKSTTGTSSFHLDQVGEKKSFGDSKVVSVKPPKRPGESRQKVVKRRRIVNNNDDYEYDLGRIKQAKKTTTKPVEQPLQKDQAFYVRILKIFR